MSRLPITLASCRLARTLCAAAVLSTLPGWVGASHHNDSAASKADARLNLTDMFVFPSRDGQSTVFVMSVGKDAGREGPKALHPDAAYDFNIDFDGDLLEDQRLRFRFESAAADGTQAWSLSRVGGRGAQATSTLLGSARQFGETLELPQGGRAWVGLAGDAFVANAVGYFKAVGSALAGRADFSAFDKPANYFAEMDVISLVVEVPNASLRPADLAVWATVSVQRDQGWAQVNRWGNVLATFVLAHNDADADLLNRGQPRDDVALHHARASARLAALVAGAGTAANPKAYGESVASRLLPMVQRYRVGTPAVYGFGASNGRALGDDSFDVMMSMVFNRALSDGVAPGKLREGFPYVPLSRRVEPWVSGR